MKQIHHITPVNLLEEKTKFLLDDQYNPQFEYEDQIEKNSLLDYGLPTPALETHAFNLVKQAYARHDEKGLEELHGPILSQQESSKKIQQFLKLHNLENKIKLSWSATYVSRTSITAKTIKLRLPTKYRSLSLLGMIYHEIGTHALRRVNYEQQPWYKKKKKYNFTSYLETEEGLAGLHTLLPRTYQSAYNAALMYLLVSWAQQGSFSAVHQKLKTYINNPEKRWRLTYRVKRGLCDTSHPGGYTKDSLYLQGMVKVWQWLADHDFDPTRLYIGKCSLSNLDKAWEMNPDFQPQLPTFFSQKKSEYKKMIQKIGKENGLGGITF